MIFVKQREISKYQIMRAFVKSRKVTLTSREICRITGLVRQTVSPCLAGLELGQPFLENGQFLLKSHGKIIRALTEAEYFKMKAYELRLFTGHWIIFSYVPTLFFIYVYPATLLQRQQETNERQISI